MEYCVVNVPRSKRFSYHGDSSSCVLDLKVAMGQGVYVAPMEWMLQDIKETLKTDNVVSVWIWYCDMGTGIPFSTEFTPHCCLLSLTPSCHRHELPSLPYFTVIINLVNL